MYVFLLSLIILVAILLVLVILAQNSKGGGLSSQFGGSGASNMIGVKKTGDLLERITWGLTVVLFLLVLSSSFLLDFTPAQQTDEFIERARQEQNLMPGLDLGGEEEGDVEIENEGGLEDLEDLGEEENQ
ncbi:MAG: preprotein translocase subunit SecG [Candidatus Cyclobacteriaceae bacterium M2_1C_046]